MPEPIAGKPDYYGGVAWLPSSVEKARRKINKSGVVFDSFAVRGVSGIVFGAKLAHVMKKNLVVVRKPNESAHASGMVEGLKPYRYLFVDDFVASGYTQRTVMDEIQREYPAAQMVGRYLYHDGELTLEGV